MLWFVNSSFLKTNFSKIVLFINLGVFFTLKNYPLKIEQKTQ